jgi:hypothetical protein
MHGMWSRLSRTAIPGVASGLAALLVVGALAGVGLIAGCDSGSFGPRELFSDDFNGTLSSSWTILHPDGSLYSLEDTYLDLRCSAGTLSLDLSDYNNAFLIDNPTTGDFVATMRVILFSPLALPYHQIAILAYDDDDNYARAIYGHINPQRQLQFGCEVAGSWSSSLTPQDFGTDPFYLRLAKTGNQYTQYYSTDGGAWTQVNGTVTYGDGTPARIGFIASDGSGGESRAHIDWFRVEGD